MVLARAAGGRVVRPVAMAWLGMAVEKFVDGPFFLGLGEHGVSLCGCR